MKKRNLLAMTLMAVLTLMPAFAGAQQDGSNSGSGMMGGQQGSMMQGNFPMGQGPMMSNMTDMMEQMSGMNEMMSQMQSRLSAMEN